VLKQSVFLEKSTSNAAPMPPIYPGEMTQGSLNFQRNPNSFANQFKSSSEFRRFHKNIKNTYRSRPREGNYTSPSNTYAESEYNGRAFHKGPNSAIHSRKNPFPLNRPADHLKHGYRSRLSSSSAQTMSTSHSQPLVQSSEGSESSGAGSKTNPNNYSYLEQDSWYKNIDQESQALKAVIRMKNKEIVALVVKANNQKKQMLELKEELQQAKSNLMKQTRLLWEEKIQHAKHKEEYAKGIKKIQNLSNDLMKKNSVWKWKHEKLSSVNRNLMEKLNRTEGKLNYSERLVAKQKEKLSGWGTVFSEANKEADTYWDICHKEDNTEETEILPRIIPEGQLLENSQGLILKDLLNLSREEWNLNNVHRIIPPQSKLNNHFESPIPHHPNKYRLCQVFEPGFRLFNPNDTTKVDNIEPSNSDFSDGCEYQLSDDEVEFWMLPKPPNVIDVEKRMTDHKKVSQYVEGYETQTGVTSQPGTPSSLSSTQHNQVYQTQFLETSQPGTPSSSSVSSTVN